MDALNTRSGIANIPHLLSIRVMVDKDKDRDSNPSCLIRTGVGRRPTPTSRTGYLSRFRPNLPTNHVKIMGTGST